MPKNTKIKLTLILLILCAGCAQTGYYMGGNSYLKEQTVQVLDFAEDKILIENAKEDSFGLVGARTWTAHCFRTGKHLFYDCSISKQEGAKAECKRNLAAESEYANRTTLNSILGW